MRHSSFLALLGSILRSGLALTLALSCLVVFRLLVFLSKSKLDFVVNAVAAAASVAIVAVAVAVAVAVDFAIAF